MAKSVAKSRGEEVQTSSIALQVNRNTKEKLHENWMRNYSIAREIWHKGCSTHKGF